MSIEAANPTLAEDVSSQFYSDTPELEAVQSEPEVSQAESEEAQTSDEGKAEAKPLESDVSEDTDQPTIELETIAAALGLDVNDLDIGDDGKVVFKSKVDGVESTVKGRDSLAAYQKQGHLDNRIREASNREENLKSQETNLQAEYQKRFSQAEQLNKIALGELQAEAQRVDWQWLRENDPSEFVIKQQEFQNRNAKIQQALAWTNDQSMQLKNQQRASEAQKVVSLMPGWDDPVFARKEEAELTSYLAANKMNPEIANYSDTYLLLKKAKAYDELTSSQPEIKKLVKSAPKVSKPGTKAKPAETPKSDADYFY